MHSRRVQSLFGAVSRVLPGAWPEVLVGLAALAVTVGPALARIGSAGPAELSGTGCAAAGAVTLGGWRRWPSLALAIGPALLLLSAVTPYQPPDAVLAVLMAYAALAAERFSGRAAWVAGAAVAGYVAALYAVTGDATIGIAMFTVPGFVAGTAVRLRRETAEALAERGRELDAERELFAELSVRNERARIAGELHDLVGHALSVMVVQASAGQRLAERSPEEAAKALTVIAESARQGRAELQRLVDLLAGAEVSSPDLSLVDEVVNQAARSGLRVSCRLEGDRDGVDAAVSHAAFRVVQEGLTNALRHAPGAPVRVLVRADPGSRGLTVLVENDPSPDPASAHTLGGGHGLAGLRERVRELGGSFSAGPNGGGGWAVRMVVPG